MRNCSFKIQLHIQSQHPWLFFDLPSNDLRLIFAYTGIVPNVQNCRASFTDSEGIRHDVEVSASTLYEAAALAIGAFRRCHFTTNPLGPATRLTITVKPPATAHELPVGKIEAWLQSGGKSPSEQVLKERLRKLLGV